MKKTLLITSLCLSLQSCLFVVGTAAGVAIAGTVVYDQRTAQATEQDRTITEAIQNKLNNIPEVQSEAHVIVTTFNRVVLIAGQVPNGSIREEVIAIAQTVPGIDSIYNELTVGGKTSSLSNTSDTWINTKLKTRLASENGLESSQIQVVTVNGNVYLMGTVSHEQADTAVAIAQNTAGVQKVVKIFSYDDPV